MEYGVIMAGGAGTRLWPLSRSNRPKQLLPVVHGKTLLRLSFDRLRGLLPAERIYVCTGAAYGEQVQANIPELPSQNILGEPIGRDTANAVGFPAAILGKRDKDAVIAVTTADHVIEPIDVFQEASCAKRAFEVVAEYPQITWSPSGIVPTYVASIPWPGIHPSRRPKRKVRLRDGSTGSYRVQAFKEKPDKATADRYVESGRYYWNSGMFVWRCDTILGELAAHLPESHAGLMKIADAWDTPQARCRDKFSTKPIPRFPRSASTMA